MSIEYTDNWDDAVALQDVNSMSNLRKKQAEIFGPNSDPDFDPNKMYVGYMCYTHSDKEISYPSISSDKPISLNILYDEIYDSDFKFTDETIEDEVKSIYSNLPEFTELPHIKFSTGDDKSKVKLNVCGNDIARNTRRGVGNIVFNNNLIYSQPHGLQILRR